MQQPVPCRKGCSMDSPIDAVVSSGHLKNSIGKRSKDSYHTAKHAPMEA